MIIIIFSLSLTQYLLLWNLTLYFHLKKTKNLTFSELNVLFFRIIRDNLEPAQVYHYQTRLYNLF